MIQSILAAVDPSEHGSVVVDYAIQVGSIFGSRICGLSVVDSKKIEGPILRDYLSTVGLDPTMDYRTRVETFYREKLSDLLDRFREQSEAAGLDYESTLERGVVHKEICKRGQNCDLVIMGKRGEHAEWNADQLGGSVQYVARTLKKPLLLTPKKHMPIGRGVVAFDGSSYSRSALELAAEIGRRTALHGTVLVVSDEDRGRAVAEEASRILESHGTAFEVVVRSGEVAATILAYADEVAADLLIMGAYGHGRIRALILGSTTEEVIGQAQIPVLLRH